MDKPSVVLTVINPKLFFGLFTYFWDRGMDILFEFRMNKEIIIKGIRNDLQVIKIGSVKFDSIFINDNDSYPFDSFFFSPNRPKNWKEIFKVMNSQNEYKIQADINYLKDKAIAESFTFKAKSLQSNNNIFILDSTEYNSAYEGIKSSKLMPSNRILFKFILSPKILNKIWVNHENNLSIYFLKEEYGEVLLFTDNVYQLLITDGIELSSDEEVYITLDSKYLEYLKKDEDYQVMVGKEYLQFFGLSTKHSIFISTKTN